MTNLSLSEIGFSGAAAFQWVNPKGWLIAIAASGAILALKLTLGLGVLALVVHLLTH